jgi:hypothetical protein
MMLLTEDFQAQVGASSAVPETTVRHVFASGG